MLNVPCICHRFALACGHANDKVSYIKTVEKILVRSGYSSRILQRKQLHMPKQSKKAIRKLQRSSQKHVGPDGCPQKRQFLGAFDHVLPPLPHLSRAFQGGNMSLTVVEPAVKFTIDKKLLISKCP